MSAAAGLRVRSLRERRQVVRAPLARPLAAGSVTGGAGPARWSVVARALFLAAAVSACGGGASDTISGPTPLPEPTPSPTPQGPQVAGGLFHLYSVEGTPLPARFEPADEAAVRDTHIAGAVIGFGTNGFVDGTEDYVSPLTQVDLAPFAYSARYVQTGDRVLVYAYGTTVAPDTAVLAGTTLTVRAQFFRASMSDRYVLTMVYRRQ